MFSMGLPIVLSMMFQAVYNIVDSAFLANMSEAGEEALTALGLAFPVQLLMVAVAIGTGVGTNALVAKSLGEKNYSRANKAAGNSIFLGFVISLLFLLFAIFIVPVYVRSQNSNGAISETAVLMCIDYLRICCGASFGIIFFSIFEKLLQACGNSIWSTISQVIGAVANIVLDPIFIFGWFGLPALGVRGAALATVLGQVASAVLGLLFHLKYDTTLKTKIKYLKPDLLTIRIIYGIGLPAIISQALLTVMTYGMNLILGRLPEIGENCVTVYGLYCKIQQMIIFAAVGMRDAITPILSFCFGMGNRKRVNEAINTGFLYTFILMVIGLVLMEALSVPLAHFFSLSDPTFTICVDCVRIVSLGFVFAGCLIAAQGIFQAIGCGLESLIVGAGRQVVFVLPVASLLSRTVTGFETSSHIWWTFMIGEILTLAVTIPLYICAYNKRIMPLKAVEGHAANH